MHTGPRTRHRLTHQREILRAYYAAAPRERPEPMSRLSAVLAGLALTAGLLSFIIWSLSLTLCP